MLNFTERIRRICEDMCRRIPELQHIDMSRVAVGFTQCRTNNKEGVLGRIIPLRFDDGEFFTIVDGEKLACQTITNSKGQEMLYLITFFLPRLYRQKPKIRLRTILHELYHIHPEFDGTLRLIDGSYHGASQNVYNRKIYKLLDKWFQLRKPNNIYDFLVMPASEVVERFGGATGVHFTPPLIYRWEGEIQFVKSSTKKINFHLEQK